MSHTASILVALAWLLTFAPAAAETATIYLRDGTVMRGEIEQTATELILRNAAGELRIPLNRIERIERATATQPATAPTTQPDASPGGTATAPANAQADPAGHAELSPRDVLRVQLSELALDGEPERVNVRFVEQPGQPELPELVRAQLPQPPDRAPDAAEEPGGIHQTDRILQRGRPHEQLQVILRETGLAHIDRIELRSEPAWFGEFRRDVLPLVLRGCARGGCHGEPDGPAPRLPAGALTDDAYVASMFLLLDQTTTPDGPLINREDDEQSVLLQYLLPPDEAAVPHPPVERARVNPVFTGQQDRRYVEMLDWIRRLRSPHPDYGLEAPTTQPAAEQVDGD